ncbi:hypothetical protein MNBD_ACTINO01-2082, partial [hydrothermal vent metagenome]
AQVPVLTGVEDLIEQGMVPGGSKRNLSATEPMCSFGPLGREARILLADAQTSGGLLLAIDEPLEAALHQALEDVSVPGWTIGRIVERSFEHGPSGIITTS